jgi:hypothetical protein
VLENPVLKYGSGFAMDVIFCELRGKKSNGAEYSAGRFYFYCAQRPTRQCVKGAWCPTYTPMRVLYLIVCIYEQYVEYNITCVCVSPRLNNREREIGIDRGTDG